MLSHAYDVKRKGATCQPKDLGHKVSGHTDFARFWFFRTFVTPSRPLILCEGATDNVYIRNAIRQLSDFYPELGTKSSKGFSFRVALFSYKNLVHKILEITGGIGPILALAFSYRKQVARYEHSPLRHPVIMLVDNDSALSKKNCGALKKHFNVNITHQSDASFFHLTHNLYLVKTPAVGSKTTSCIEDLFDGEALALTLDGKFFHPKNEDFDSTKHIGKAPFATKVVARNADTISWKGFAPLLDRIVEVLADYERSHSTKNACLSE